MLKQKQHTRFKISKRNEQLSLVTCYWYAPTLGSIVPIGNDEKSIQQRPDSIRM